MAKKKMIISCVLILALVVTGVAAYWLQKNKEPVSERIRRKTSETDTAEKTKAADVTDTEVGSDSDNATTEDYRGKSGDNILMIGSVKVELLSADVLDGRNEEVSTETKYPVEYFKSQSLPADNVTEDVTDWDTILEVSPEFKEFNQAPFGTYTGEETVEKMESFSDLIDSYTTTVVRPQKVYFIKCRLTNESSSAAMDTLPLEVTSVSDTGKMTYREDLKYFDKPIYTEGEDRDKKYFFFKLAGHESMECTIGLVVPQEFDENDRHYYGDSPFDASGGSIQYDPTVLPNFVDIDALPKPEE